MKIRILCLLITCNWLCQAGNAAPPTVSEDFDTWIEGELVRNEVYPPGFRFVVGRDLSVISIGSSPALSGNALHWDDQGDSIASAIFEWELNPDFSQGNLTISMDVMVREVYGEGGRWLRISSTPLLGGEFYVALAARKSPAPEEWTLLYNQMSRQDMQDVSLPLNRWLRLILVIDPANRTYDLDISDPLGDGLLRELRSIPLGAGDRTSEEVLPQVLLIGSEQGEGGGVSGSLDNLKVTETR